MKAIKKHLTPRTAATLRWIAVLPAAIGSVFLLVLPCSLVYSNPFLFDLPPAIITYGRSALLVCIALTVAAITAPSRKKLVFWVAFAIWIGFDIARSISHPSDGSTLSFPQPNLYISLVTCLLCALIVFLLLHCKNFRIVPKKWAARIGVILGLYALTAFFHLYPTLHVWKLRLITRHHPEIIQHQLYMSALNDFGYSKVTPTPALPQDLLTLQQQAISEAHRLHGSAGMTPYFFKISNRHGIWHCLFAHKQTSRFSSYSQFWLSEEHGIYKSGSGRSGSLNNVGDLPDRVSDALAEFHLFYASDCTQRDTFPEKLLEWHPTLQNIIEKHITPNQSDAFYFKNEHDDYLLAWDRENLTSCLRVNTNEVLALDPENYDAFINVNDIELEDDF